uniref:Uncharacterized protein n=1 Tax=Ananas comosus var. bracteatus TaxID=296719 RepID=A0A6V7QPK3_ANACO|nr:unnamed protein product [Ananas comosus var. bracteatus]
MSPETKIKQIQYLASLLLPTRPWLVLKKRPLTADNPLKRGLLTENIDRMLYGMEEKTVDHLFTQCVFSKFLSLMAFERIQSMNLECTELMHAPSPSTAVERAVIVIARGVVGPVLAATGEGALVGVVHKGAGSEVADRLAATENVDEAKALRK